jgi:hypothetical protein
VSSVFSFISVYQCLSVASLPSIRGLRAAGGLRARDLAVGFRPAIAIKLPGRAHFLNLIKVQVGDEQFVLVPAVLRDDLATRIAEIALDRKSVV